MPINRETIYVMKKTILFILPLLMLCSCKGKAGAHVGDEDERTIIADKSSKTAEVKAVKLVTKDFSHEVVSNGKVVGHNRADLSFSGGEGIITGVYVKNGSPVKRGQKLATLDDYKPKEALRKAESALAKSELELKDALIGQGYDPDDYSAIPADVMKLARLRSGYDDALATVADARHAVEETVLTAPFDGVVANLTGKVFNRPDNSKPFCTLIGNGMDVTFRILEGELPLMKVGDGIMVSPYSSDTEYRGKVTEINPVVDENGMVTVNAAVEQGRGLYDGMNVKISVQKSLGRQLVVPKSAVVLRSGRQVVFTLNEKGDKALWNYVHTGLENMGEYTIVDGLEEGMRVIVSGNVSLAHEAPVKVTE